MKVFVITEIPLLKHNVEKKVSLKQGE